MDAHKFNVGDMVAYRDPMHGGERGAFKIEKLLPANAVENQYGVIRSADNRRRLAGESELSVILPAP